MPFGQILQKQSPLLNPGRLRHKIDLVVTSRVQDEIGGWDVSRDVVYANVWASIEALTGIEKFAAHENVSAVTHQIVIRYIGAAPSWQPLFTYYGVDSVEQTSLVIDRNGNLQQAQSGGGTSGATEPVWNTTVGGTTSDGDPSTGVVWKNLGTAPRSSGVNAAMQVWFQERQFQVEAVLNPDERNKMLLLMCIEIDDSMSQKKGQQPGGLG